jgi:hypothetical protein
MNRRLESFKGSDIVGMLNVRDGARNAVVYCARLLLNPYY